MDLSFFENKYVLAGAASIGGVLLTLLTQQIANKRALFTYFVRHSRVGVSDDDAVFGSVRVTWNDTQIANLYLSTVELINQSLRDYENLAVTLYTNDTVLLTERTELVGTPNIIKWTDEFLAQLKIPPGEKPTKAQFDLHSRRREYIIPVMNRSQVARFHFLNAVKTQNQPSVWLDVLHKGVRLDFRPPQVQILEVPQPRAALIQTH